MGKLGHLLTSAFVFIMIFTSVLVFPVMASASSNEGQGYIIVDGNENGLPTKKSGDFMYALLDGNAVICKYVGKNSAVVIPDMIDGKKVTRIGVDSFKNNTRITSVSIPEGVNHISGNSFLGCVSLKSINLPKDLTYIGGLAFYGSGLNSISIINKDTFIDIGAFQASSLESVTFPEGFSGESMEAAVFKNCDKLKNVSLPTGMFRIPQDTFYGCSYLTNIVLPNGLKEIGESAFAESGLERIDIPNGVTAIGYNAFLSCQLLVDIKLPGTLKQIDDMAFGNCQSIEKVDIPSGMTTVGISMFTNCANIKTVTMADSVTKIGAKAFEECVALESVKLSKNLKVIGDDAFIATGLTSITVPGSVTDFEYGGTFSGCKKLTQVTLENKLAIIPAGMFNGCSSLKSITIPSSVKKVMPGAFSGCASLESVTVMGNTIIEDSFEGCTKIKTLTCKTMYGLSGGPVKKGTWLYNILDAAPKCVIYAPKGSTGEMLAKAYKIKFVAIPATK